MKKYILLLSLLGLLLLGLSGCQNDYQKQLTLMVESLNNECPIPLGAIGHMDKAEYDGKSVTFHYTLTGALDAEKFEQNQDQFHQYMLDNYRSNSDESGRQLIKAIVDAEADLNVVFTTERGDNFSLHFTNEELSDNMPSFVADPEAYLKSTLQSTRLQLPITYSEGMVCQEIALDSEYFTYYIVFDQNKFSIKEMQESASTNHDAMCKMITTSSDPSFLKMMQMLKATNRGLRYIYTDTISGEEAIVAITPDEL